MSRPVQLLHQLVRLLLQTAHYSCRLQQIFFSRPAYLGWATPSAGRPQGAAPEPAVAQALCEPLPAEVAALTDLMPATYRTGVVSIASRAGAELGGSTDADDSFWRNIESDPDTAVLRTVHALVLENAQPERRDAWEPRLTELLTPPLVTLRARAATFRRLKSDQDGDCWNRCARWDAVPHTSLLRVEIEALDWLAEYRVKIGEGVEPVTDEVTACPICMCGVTGEVASEEDVKAGRAVRIAMYWPCYHRACSSCLAKEALASAARARGLPADKRAITAKLESPGAAAEVEAAVRAGRLRCPLCPAIVEWPWDESKPWFKGATSMPPAD